MSAAADAHRTTVLHDWHAANGARLVDFAGWRMPVQYADGIIAEHLATRRGAGLFDVSHMGRFRVGGADAEAFLDYALTNNASALAPGEAQYTFIANEHGGAVDDAYLYRLGDADWLLVVNASNREKDWAALEARRAGFDAAMEDASDALAMIALQGPQASVVLEHLVDARALPENKRNRIATVSVDGHPMVVARTGYTGEAVCFEMFPARERAVALWERLVAAGATPVGLGARDSLRLEAGLPLYGHELGPDPDGRDIPIFANALARFAVRASGERDFVGREALHAQREEYVRILRGEIDVPPQQRLLTHLVRPIAVFEGRRPLRAGHAVRLDGEPIGYVTSGTVVPFAPFEGAGVGSTPAPDEHHLRPIGLAMLRSDVAWRPDRPTVLEVVDGRGKASRAELVEKNAWSTSPYVRAYRGFEAPAEPARTDPGEVSALAARLRESARANTDWRRRRCVNLIPSEQCTSAFVESLCVEDPAGRYNEHNRLKAFGPNAPDVRYYCGTAWIMEREEELKAALRAFFGCARVEPRVVSGQMANDTVYDALKQFRNRMRTGDTARPLARVLVHDLNKGGHLSAQIGGALKNYVAIDPATERPAVDHFPMRADSPHAVDVEGTCEIIDRRPPDLIVFGRSVIIHREPVAAIAQFVHRRFGRDNPERPLIMYDGAHVLGLLGPHFQAPFEEGADVVTGSTHKTFFGPQRGVILSDIEPGSALEPFWRLVESRTFPGHVSNHHLGTLLGLLGATYEMIAHRDAYPPRVIGNARAFARALAGHGLAVEGDADAAFTDTHQVLLRGARARGGYLADLLEANNVITNPQAFYDDPSFAAASGVRMGAQEMTRFGMEAGDFETLAGLVAEIVAEGGRRPAGHWRETVERFRSGFLEMRYTL